jgi:antitoxin (DNA-binding transcriptional repressor) of toxin-antitoxin stability system
MEVDMIMVAKRELKARMPAYFRLVEQDGEELVVTDRSHPVLKVVPLKEALTVKQAFGDIRKLVQPASEHELAEPAQNEWRFERRRAAGDGRRAALQPQCVSSRSSEG